MMVLTNYSSNLLYNKNAGMDRFNWFTGDDKPVFIPERSTVTQEGGRPILTNTPIGQGWLSLATLYERFPQGINEHGHILQYFGETYQQLGVQAAQETARLDPEAIGPHYELALLYASALPQNPSPEELQPVLDEIEMMQVNRKWRAKNLLFLKNIPQPRQLWSEKRAR